MGLVSPIGHMATLSDDNSESADEQFFHPFFLNNSWNSLAIDTMSFPIIYVSFLMGLLTDISNFQFHISLWEFTYFSVVYLIYSKYYNIHIKTLNVILV